MKVRTENKYKTRPNTRKMMSSLEIADSQKESAKIHFMLILVAILKALLCLVPCIS